MASEKLGESLQHSPIQEAQKIHVKAQDGEIGEETAREGSRQEGLTEELDSI
jgi:hypothetical protein